MTYESAQSIFGMAGLIIFVVLFAGVLAYIFWPGNQKGFEEASRIPLEKDDLNLGGSNGR
ncbi:MAG: cbb3-type cytochrome c oxidase subunit 3 [Rhodomicrobium sp.]